MNTKIQKRIRRHKRVRAKIIGTAKIPRLCVFKSNIHIYAQLIDDASAKTLASTNDMSLKGTKMEGAIAAGKEIAKLAKAKGIETVVFDRNGFKYAGRIKALADSAREAGLKF
jgi:large subunit ribosomal protein L18